MVIFPHVAQSSELSITKRKEERTGEREEIGEREVTELSYFGLRRSNGGSDLIMCSQSSQVSVTRFVGAFL